ncbi:MAG: type II secretion system protein GspG [Janthinobacterium lividum]
MKDFAAALVLAALVMPAFAQTNAQTNAQYGQLEEAGRKDAAKTLAAQQEIAVIGQALQLYRKDHSAYPSQSQGLGVLGAYLQRLPNDPWGNPYQYRNPGAHGDVDVFTTGGAVGQDEGGSTVIGSWQ